MSDPDIIKSSTPHRVSIAEGSSNAVGKKAEVGEASIRKVLSDASSESNEITQNEDELKKLPWLGNPCKIKKNFEVKKRLSS